MALPQIGTKVIVYIASSAIHVANLRFVIKMFDSLWSLGVFYFQSPTFEGVLLKGDYSQLLYATDTEMKTGCVGLLGLHATFTLQDGLHFWVMYIVWALVHSE